MQYKFGKKGDLLNFSVSDIFNSVAGVVSRKLETEGINLSARVDFSQTTFSSATATTLAVIKSSPPVHGRKPMKKEGCSMRS